MVMVVAVGGEAQQAWATRGSDAQVESYQGPDRRRSSTLSVTCDRSRDGARALEALVVGTVLVIAGSAAMFMLEGPDAIASEWLTASTSAVSAAAGALYAMRWRLVGDGSSLWIAGGLFAYSAASVSAVASVAIFVVLVLFVVAVRAPVIDAGLRPRRVVVFAVIAAVAGSIPATWLPAFRMVVGPEFDQPPADQWAAMGQLMVAALWIALAASFARRGRAVGGTGTWISVLLVARAEGRVALALSVPTSVSWVLASQLFRLLAVAAALFGAVAELRRAFVEQRAQLLQSTLALDEERARRDAARASEEERAHDLRGALAGIGAATVTLERHCELLSGDERAQLARMVSCEIARLYQLIDDAPETPSTLSLLETLGPLLSCTTASADVQVDIAPGLLVTASPSATAEIVQNLIGNARRHAGGSHVVVRAELSHGRVLLRVEDRGPGVPAAHRQQIFERGWRDSTSSGSGLGLFVSAKLARGQGGDLWVEDRDGGGASFVLSFVGARTEVGE